MSLHPERKGSETAASRTEEGKVRPSRQPITIDNYQEQIQNAYNRWYEARKAAIAAAAKHGTLDGTAQFEAANRDPKVQRAEAAWQRTERAAARAVTQARKAGPETRPVVEKDAANWAYRKSLWRQEGALRKMSTGPAENAYYRAVEKEPPNSPARDYSHQLFPNRAGKEPYRVYNWYGNNGSPSSGPDRSREGTVWAKSIADAHQVYARQLHESLATKQKTPANSQDRPNSSTAKAAANSLARERAKGAKGAKTGGLAAKGDALDKVIAARKAFAANPQDDKALANMNKAMANLKAMEQGAKTPGKSAGKASTKARANGSNIPQLQPGYKPSARARRNAVGLIHGPHEAQGTIHLGH